ncbi:MAG: PEGA domain-containing protein [Nitrospira sp.]|nr:PEGA domain-containing protein [Nitrospira sp.]
MAETSHPGSVQRTVGIACLTVCYLNLTACSLFGGTSQSLTVNSDPPGANVLINGTSAGTTPLQYQVPRRGDLTVEVQKPGYTPQTRVTGRKLSSVGIVDVIGGALFLLPLLGLIAPGAWEQDPGIIGITLEPDHSQPAQPQ